MMSQRLSFPYLARSSIVKDNKAQKRASSFLGFLDRWPIWGVVVRQPRLERRLNPPRPIGLLERGRGKPQARLLLIEAFKQYSQATCPSINLKQYPLDLSKWKITFCSRSWPR